MLKLFHLFLVVLVLTCYSARSGAVIDAYITSAARTEQSELTTPASITVITREEIENSGASHVIDVLRGAVGISVDDLYGDGSRSSVSMRGFSSSAANSNTLVLVDGRRLNNTDISGPDLNSVSLMNVERIEIVQGSAGVLFGDQAVGGVINIITSGAARKTGTVEAVYGSYGKVGVKTAYGDSITEKLSYTLSAEAKQSDNYRRDNNDIEYASLNAVSAYRYSEGELSAELQYVKEDLGLPGALLDSEVAMDRRQTFADFINDYADSRTDVIRLASEHSINSVWKFQGEATYRDVERDIQQSFRGFVINTPARLNQKQVEFTPRINGVLPVDNGDIHIVAGIDLIDTSYESELTFASDDQVLFSEYVQIVVPVMEKLNATLGYRYARAEDEVTSSFVNGQQHDDIGVAEFGLSYKVSDTYRFFGRIDQNFRFAKVDELTYVSPGTQLKPQSGESYELGVQYERGDLSLGLTGYRLLLEDEIAFDPTAIQPVGPFPGANVNFDPTVHEGITVESRYEFAPGLDIAGSYSFSNAYFDSGIYAGNKISGVPDNTARINISYGIIDALDLNLDAVYAGSKYQDGDNSNSFSKVSGYTVLGSNLIYAYQDWRVSFRINNITDRKYVESVNVFGARFPMPERNYLLTASWNFK